MLIEIVTLFPEGIGTLLDESILRRAAEAGAVEFRLVQLREFATDKHATVDDRPLGGGPGMVLKPEPIARAIRALARERPDPPPHVILTSPQGRTFSQRVAEELSRRERLLILCGHYKGVDQRAIDEFVDEQISIGDYVLTGGELPAAVIVDAVVRLLPGVLGDPESAAGDSFSHGLLDHPHYTQPAQWEGKRAPEVLTSGHHARVDQWRLNKRIERTRELRPDMYERWRKRGGPEN
ncbi:MAG: tRNA (guanine-N(1)-)-methyltransferase [Calditrichaeota bacterium]|nr:tRNA (guanine-N(1)-)-methyltransferase [Calditrichota bacterium]